MARRRQGLHAKTGPCAATTLSWQERASWICVLTAVMEAHAAACAVVRACDADEDDDI